MSLTEVKLLAARGFHVVPMRGKRPLPGVEWRHVGAPSEATIESYWGGPNPPGVAIVCKQLASVASGADAATEPTSGALWIGALDLDDEAAAAAMLPLVQDRYYCERSKRGLHIPFLSRNEVRGRNQIVPKVADLKGFPGLLVCAPSKGYTPVNDLPWAVVDDGTRFAEGLLRDIGHKVNLERVAVGEIVGGDHMIEEHGTHEGLLKVRGALARMGFEGRWLYAALSGINADRCVTPLPDRELREIATWKSDKPLASYVGDLFEVVRMHPGMKVDDPPPDLIEGFIPGRKWISFLYGGGGSGKSYIATLAAICVAAGVDFLDAPTIGPMPVLYVDCELDSDEFTRRVGALCRGLGIDIPRSLTYMKFTDAMSNERVYDLLTQELTVAGQGFVVIDSISFALGGMDLAQAHQVTPYLLKLKALNVPTLVIAHEAKLQVDRFGKKESAVDKTLYGSVMQFNFSRNIWHAVHGEEGFDHMGVTLFHTKATSGKFEGEFSVRIDGVRDLHTITLSLEETDVREVIELLRRRSHGVSTKEIADALDITQNRAVRIIRNLKASEGVVEIDKRDRTPLYALADPLTVTESAT